MASRTKVKNPSVILRDFRKSYERAGFTNSDARDTKIRAISQPAVEEIVSLSAEYSASLKQLQIESCKRKALDDIGALYNKPRLNSTFATVDANENSLCLYVSNGTFGDINGGNDIIINSPVNIFSRENENELGERITYRVEGPLILPADSRILFISAKSVTDGPLGNVGAQVLVNHDFTGYIDSNASSLKVLNVYPILNGEPQESDNRYRSRLISYLKGIMGTNYDSIRADAVQVPGVRSVELERGYFGIGSSAAFVRGPEGKSNERMVAGVQQQLRASTPPGGLVQALPMVEVGMDIELSVKANTTLSRAARNRIETTLRQELLLFIRNSQSNSFIDLDSFRQIAISSLSSFGVNISSDSFFKKVYVSRYYGGGTNLESNMLTGTTYSFQEFEYPNLTKLTINFE